MWVSLYDPLLCWGQTTPSTWCNEIMVEMRLFIILYLLNSLTFWCDQVRISPYSFSLISCRKVMWIKKNDHLGGYKLFQCQILQNDFIRIAWLTLRRNEMLGSERVVKELSKYELILGYSSKDYFSIDWPCLCFCLSKDLWSVSWFVSQ